MSLETWGDEGNVPSNGHDTAVYQELRDLENRVRKWRTTNKNDFSNDEQSAKADKIIDLIDELAEELGEWEP